MNTSTITHYYYQTGLTAIPWNGDINQGNKIIDFLLSQNYLARWYNAKIHHPQYIAINTPNGTVHLYPNEYVVIDYAGLRVMHAQTFLAMTRTA